MRCHTHNTFIDTLCVWELGRQKDSPRGTGNTSEPLEHGKDWPYIYQHPWSSVAGHGTNSVWSTVMNKCQTQTQHNKTGPSRQTDQPTHIDSSSTSLVTHWLHQVVIPPAVVPVWILSCLDRSKWPTDHCPCISSNWLNHNRHNTSR